MNDPARQMESMKQQGYNNSQVVDEMQRQGYSGAQMRDALQQPQMPLPAPPSYDPSSDTEEMVEAIIDEKWNDLMGDINKVIAWKEATESKIIKFEQQLEDVKDQFDNLHKAVVGKVGEYDKHILDVGADVKAMEKVFSKVLPVFTDTVAELARITDGIKIQSSGSKRIKKR